MRSAIVADKIPLTAISDFDLAFINVEQILGIALAGKGIGRIRH
jgi:hypothetical protein